MFDWNEKKRIATLEDRKLDFMDADLVFESSNKPTIESNRSGETRWMDLAEVSGTVFVLVYTFREDRIRIISYRKASRRERKLYYENIL